MGLLKSNNFSNIFSVILMKGLFRSFFESELELTISHMVQQ